MLKLLRSLLGHDPKLDCDYRKVEDAGVSRSISVSLTNIPELPELPEFEFPAIEVPEDKTEEPVDVEGLIALGVTGMTGSMGMTGYYVPTGPTGSTGYYFPCEIESVFTFHDIPELSDKKPALCLKTRLTAACWDAMLKVRTRLNAHD